MLSCMSSTKRGLSANPEKSANLYIEVPESIKVFGTPKLIPTTVSNR